MTQSFDQAMRAFEPALPLGVAYSGGADSSALLVACARQWPGQVVAIHVNHGLQAAATDFEAHCRSVCSRLGIPLHVEAVHAHAVPGQSPEDAARIARYKAFDTLALTECAGVAIKSIAIAQHAGDQVETVLLALGRGAGLAGLSGMPAQWQRGNVQFHRPLLQVAGEALKQWLVANHEPWVLDPTNADYRYTRNHIRSELLPALQGVFPQFLDTFARSARHAAEAESLLAEMADEDWGIVEREATGRPDIRRLQALSPARQSNVLRRWLKQGHGVIPRASQLLELRKQVQACTTRGHRIYLKVGHGFVTLRGSTLEWQVS
ncbi:MAG: tRNA lysidine(34) synthetase TilS [Betaproteobacteria bacterium]|nr:tRNA lysidine(34) synthetase TilS [Betaproteobacteria bacterium]